MRREDEKRHGKMLHQWHKDRAEEERIRKQNERRMPLILPKEERGSSEQK